MTGSEMHIEMPSGFLYHFDLNKELDKTLIWGEDWDNLGVHYGLYYFDQIVVHLDGDQEFFKANVFDKHGTQKHVISTPGKNIFVQMFSVDMLGYILY